MILEKVRIDIQKKIIVRGLVYMIDFRGKQTGDVPASGELSTNKAADIL